MSTQSTIPIPQDAVIAPQPQQQAASGNVAIPQDAIVESAPGKGIAPLNDAETQQLKKSYENRPLWRKMFGLGIGPGDAQGQQLENRMFATQQQGMTKSPMVQQQVGTAAIGTGVVAGAAASPLAIEAAPAVARLALKHPVATAFAYHVAREAGIPLPKILDIFKKLGGD